MLQEKIKHLIESAFSDEGTNEEITISVPEVKNHGHFSTNFAFILAKQKKVSPMEAAEKIKTKVVEKDGGEMLDKVEVVVPGFVNFWLAPKAIQDSFGRLAGRAGESKRNQTGESQKSIMKLGKGKKVIVEYSSPNIAKPMHVGHFRSTIIGDALANIYEAVGYKVIRWNYLGDWGVQFGKLTAAYKMWGDKNALKVEPINHLLELYVRFNAEAKNNPDMELRGREEFKKLEDGDKENKKLWETFRKESIKEFNKVYKTLGVNFDVVMGESYYESHLKPLIEELKDKKLAQKSEGALIIDLEKYGLPSALIEKSDGASLYFTREIANIKYRISEYNADKIIYVVGLEQSLHFKQLFKVAGLLGLGEDKFYHVGNGLVLGEDGKKLSTREGKTFFIEDVISQAIDKTRNIIDEKNPDLSAKEKDEISKSVAIGALKYNDLSQNRETNITFDWDRMLSFEGDSGPYLQYTYARLMGILRKAKSESSKEFDAKNLNLEIELGIIMKLDAFPEIIKYSAETFYPNHLAKYLYDLASIVNRYYHEQPVLKADPQIRPARLALINSASKTIKKSLNLLGIETLEKM